MIQEKETICDNCIKKTYFTLEEIEEESRDECVSKLDVIKDIYLRLIATPLMDIQSEYNNDINDTLSELFELYEIKDFDSNSITVADFISLIYGIGEIESLGDDVKKKKQYFAAILRRYLVNVVDEHDLVTLFMKCSVSRFERMLIINHDEDEDFDAKARRFKVSRIYERIRNRGYCALDIRVSNRQYTFEKFCSDMRKHMNSSWTPWRSEAGYKERIKTTYELICLVLIELPVTAMPEKFDIDLVMKRNVKQEVKTTLWKSEPDVSPFVENQSYK